jgi:signal transduction histidine kinase
MRVVAYVLYALAAYFLFVDYQIAQGIRPGDYRYFLYVDIALIAILSGHLLLSVMSRRARGSATAGARSRMQRVLPISFGCWILLWSILVAAAEHQVTGDVTTFVIAVMAVSVLLLAQAPTMALMLAGGGFALNFVEDLTGRGPERLLQEHPFVIGLMVIAFTISRIIYHQYVGELVARERLTGAQSDLSKANAELRDAYRRLQDAQLQLIRQEKLASIGYLSAGIAHEINNPLGYLKSNVQTLVDRLERIDLQSLEINELVQDINEAISRITRVVHGLTEFARPHAADQLESFDLHEGIEGALEIARNSYKYVAEVERDYGTLPKIVCRRSEINQVLLSILVNAAEAVASAYDHTEARGSIRITTRARRDTVICDITNDGPAIPGSDRELIFEPFYTTKQSQRGAGLGLSLAREIVVDRHGGDLMLVESDEETTFRLELPVRGN